MDGKANTAIVECAMSFGCFGFFDQTPLRRTVPEWGGTKGSKRIIDDRAWSISHLERAHGTKEVESMITEPGECVY